MKLEQISEVRYSEVFHLSSALEYKKLREHRLTSSCKTQPAF